MSDLIKKLSATQKKELERVQKGLNAKAAKKAHAVVLADKGYSVPEIAAIYFTIEEQVNEWLTNWNQYGIKSLYNAAANENPSRADEIIQSLDLYKNGTKFTPIRKNGKPPTKTKNLTLWQLRKRRAVFKPYSRRKDK